MMDTITTGSTTITPSIILGYESMRESRNIVHAILGRESPDVTLRPAALRTGTLRLGFSGPGAETASRNAETAHSLGAVLNLNSDRDTADMSYVVAGGSVQRELEDTTRDAWIVTVPFQEVTP